MMTTDQPLKNRTVALPESRQLDLLAELNQQHLDARAGGQELAARIEENT